MVFADGLLGLVFLAVWIFCIIDAITTPAEQVRNLPKIAWIFIVILLVDVGSVIWLVAGRNWDKAAASAARAGGLPGTRPSGRGVPSNPDDDEDFQRVLRDRAAEQRRRAREATDGDTPAGPS